jgi:hypothetical protein
MNQDVVIHNPETALTLFSADSVLAVVQAALRENMGVGGVTQFDFDRIKIPSGGGPSFLVQAIDGERNERTVTGVIVLARDARAYWEKSLDDGGGSQPPDCHSNDGLIGIGTFQGKTCSECPMAQFGTDPKSGRGQACKAIRQLFMVQAGSMLPSVLALPPTSLKPAKQYMVRLAGQGIPYWSVGTTIGLEPAQNAGGIKYAKATFKFAGRLPAEQVAKAKAYSNLMKSLVGHFTIEASQYREDV